MPDERLTLLREIADTLHRRRLDAPARLLLDVITPVGVIASQAALFARPLIPVGRWRTYLAALEHESSWKQLRGCLDEHEC